MTIENCLPACAVEYCEGVIHHGMLKSNLGVSTRVTNGLGAPQSPSDVVNLQPSGEHELFVGAKLVFRHTRAQEVVGVNHCYENHNDDGAGYDDRGNGGADRSAICAQALFLWLICSRAFFAPFRISRIAG